MLTKSQIALLNGLHQVKNRYQEKLFLVEGYKTIEMLQKSDYKVVQYFATVDFDSDRISIPHDSIKEVTTAELQKLSGFKNPQPVFALVQMPEAKVFAPIGAPLLVLDGISDPGNLGTIIRLAHWFGIKQILANDHTVDVYNPKVIQSAMGSSFFIDIHYTDLTTALHLLKLESYQCIATAMNGLPIQSFNLPSKAAILIGNEANGISEQLLQLCDETIAIPNFSEGVAPESLNAAVTAGIVMAKLKMVL